MKRILSLLLTLALVWALGAPAMAGTSVSQTQRNIPNFLFVWENDGIGCGVCPVYTAPSYKAFRCNGGKAAVDTNSKLAIVGFEPNGWLMVRYATGSGSTRVGYIPPDYTKGRYSTWRRTDFAYVEQRAASSLRVTDNPLDNYSYYAVLDPGETYYILGEYTYYGNWWYIECTVDGLQARGFIRK